MGRQPSIMKGALVCVLLCTMLGPGSCDMVPPLEPSAPQSQPPDIRDLVSTGTMSVCELPRMILAQLRELILTSINQVKICMEHEKAKREEFKRFAYNTDDDKFNVDNFIPF